MKKKGIALFLALAMTGSLAGCGGTSEPAAADTQTKTEEAAGTTEKAEETAKEETKAEEASAGGSVADITVPGTELNITTTFAGEESNVLNYQNAVQAWMDKTGCVVNDSSATADEAFKARVVSDFETGAEPDVLFYFNGNDSNPFVEAGKGVSIDEIRKVYPDYASNMKDSMLEATASPADGVCYSVPFYGY